MDTVVIVFIINYCLPRCLNSPTPWLPAFGVLLRRRKRPTVGIFINGDGYKYRSERLPIAYDHTTLNVRELVRSRKSSSVGPGQYLDRRRLGNPRCRKLFGAL
uniref:Secreted protein n=1 Tax=Steinernema glaseri TaxID=37863 RepID=A0A1I7YSE7_9BILA